MFLPLESKVSATLCREFKDLGTEETERSINTIEFREEGKAGVGGEGGGANSQDPGSCLREQQAMMRGSGPEVFEEKLRVGLWNAGVPSPKSGFVKGSLQKELVGLADSWAKDVKLVTPSSSNAPSKPFKTEFSFAFHPLYTSQPTPEEQGEEAENLFDRLIQEPHDELKRRCVAHLQITSTFAMGKLELARSLTYAMLGKETPVESATLSDEALRSMNEKEVEV